MSDNKFYDTLEFDDDIDFDGLDEEAADDIQEEIENPEINEEYEEII